MTTKKRDEQERFTYKDLVEVTSFECKPLTAEQKYSWLCIAISKFRDVELIKELISEGACVNFPDPNHHADFDLGLSPLHYCVDCDLLEGVSVLVDAGANVNIRALTGYRLTPLHLAIVHNNLRMVKMLLAHGADPYCPVGGVGPILGKPFQWDCFEMANVFKNDEVMAYFSEYKLLQEQKVKLSNNDWREESEIPEGMTRPTAVYLNQKIYVGDRWMPVNSRKYLHVFDIFTREWSKLRFHNSCEMWGFTLATTKNLVHTLGGEVRKDDELELYSNNVFTLDGNLKWFKTLPPLNIGRIWAASTSFEDFIVIAGGRFGNGQLSSVEVLNSSDSSSAWWTISDLPMRSSLVQCTATLDQLFIGFGARTRMVYTATLDAIKEYPKCVNDLESASGFWQSLPVPPLKFCGLVTINNCVVIMGGTDEDDELHSSVYLYDHCKQTWAKVSQMNRNRDSPAVVACTSENYNQEVFVIGGDGANNSVESFELM